MLLDMPVSGKGKTKIKKLENYGMLPVGIDVQCLGPTKGTIDLCQAL